MRSYFPNGMNALTDLTCAFPDRLDETDFMYIRNRPKHGKALQFVLEKEMLLTN